MQATCHMTENVGRGAYFLQGYQCIVCQLHIFRGVQIRRPYDSCLWFDHKTNRGHKNALFNAISEKEHLEKENKEGTKRPAKRKISLISLGFGNEKIPKPTTSGDKKAHDKTCSSPRYPLRSHSLVCIENHLFIVRAYPMKTEHFCSQVVPTFLDRFRS